MLNSLSTKEADSPLADVVAPTLESLLSPSPETTSYVQVQEATGPVVYAVDYGAEASPGDLVIVAEDGDRVRSMLATFELLTSSARVMGVARAVCLPLW